MSEGDISQISVGEFETVSQLLASSESLQLAFIIMIIGIIAISAAYRKFSSLIKSKKIFYTKPHLSRFVQNAVLPFFAIALISSTNAYIQTSELFENDSSIIKKVEKENKEPLLTSEEESKSDDGANYGRTFVDDFLKSLTPKEVEAVENELSPKEQRDQAPEQMDTDEKSSPSVISGDEKWVSITI